MNKQKKKQQVKKVRKDSVWKPPTLSEPTPEREKKAIVPIKKAFSRLPVRYKTPPFDRAGTVFLNDAEREKDT